MERIYRLTELLGRPQHNFRSIHIGGTNGKGSTSVMLSRVLSAGGYKTGLFVSPHLHSYRERFQIDGDMISASALADCLSRIDELLPVLIREGHSHPTEFEVLTAAAFLYFSEQSIDIAVVEVGMGGLYDSTNIINPLVSIITNVELDHTAYLGNTIQEIAINKAGIIKPGVPVITGEKNTEALKVLGQKANTLGAEMLIAPELVKVDLIRSSLQGQKAAVTMGKHREEICLGLTGAYQRENLALVWLALDCLKKDGFEVTEAARNQALADCKWPGRLELIGENPIVILDAGHNEAGARAARLALEEMAPDQSFVVVAGILDDKDARSFLANLPQSTKTVIITRPDSPRAQNWQQRAELAREYYDQVHKIEVIEEAVKYGLAVLEPEEILLVTGSFYVLDRARKYLLSNFR